MKSIGHVFVEIIGRKNCLGPHVYMTGKEVPRHVIPKIITWRNCLKPKSGRVMSTRHWTNMSRQAEGDKASSLPASDSTRVMSLREPLFTYITIEFVRSTQG